MDWRVFLIEVLLRLIETRGPEILDAIGDLILALIKSLTPAQKGLLAKKAGVSDEILKEFKLV